MTQKVPPPIIAPAISNDVLGWQENILRRAPVDKQDGKRTLS